MAPLRRARALLFAGLAMLVAMTACAAPATNPPPPTPDTVPATAADLPGIWVTGIEVKSPDTPFLVVYRDGSWRGSDGCNGASGTWSVDANGVLANTSGPHTLIYCDGEALPTAFTDATSAAMHGEQLLLLDPAGQTLFTLKRVDEIPTTSRGTADVVGWWGSSDTSSPRQIFLDITSDGRFTGNDGCNTFSGEWKFSETGAVALGPFVIPILKECAGFTPWLTTGSSALVDGDDLVVTNSIGIEQGHLVRSAVPSTNNPSPSPTASSKAM